jgi:SAM-dependent methyltransferase
MQLPLDTPEIIEFHCNICGTQNRLENHLFHRELAACKSCGSTPRFRGVIYVLGHQLGGLEDVPLLRWPVRKAVSGAGLSDWDRYATPLSRKFSYENTFYDRRPQLDIMQPDGSHLGKYDFLISTDVFEHILPPVQRGFDNLLRLLKPGGCLVFSVPYTRAAATFEHYPGLHEFEILEFHGKRVLVNRDEEGRLQVHENLVFHGGEGATLELRLFCEADLLRRLEESGFEEIHVYDRPVLGVGYYWPELRSPDSEKPSIYGYLISARRPPAARVNGGT